MPAEHVVIYPGRLTELFAHMYDCISQTIHQSIRSPVFALEDGDCVRIPL
jgi:hypothetical protein